MWFRNARWWARLIGLSGASRMRLRVGYGEDSEVSGRSRAGPRIAIPESMAKTASSASQRPKSRLAHGSPLSPAKVSVQEVVVEGHNSHPFTSHILWLNDFIDFSMIYGQHEFLQVHNAISLDMN